MTQEKIGFVGLGLMGQGMAKNIVEKGYPLTVVAALGVTTLEIGPEIAPGVPWTRSISGPDLVLALKSGNFGAEDFFLKAWTLLETEPADV